MHIKHANFEKQVSVHANSFLWDIEDIQKVVTSKSLAREIKVGKVPRI